MSFKDEFRNALMVERGARTVCGQRPLSSFSCDRESLAPDSAIGGFRHLIDVT